ncbi:hypothetical protein EDD11_002071 [Mortierella claussenii]|nr:hypothetical protein EDD11_002071 [Mortierella claussenii]
MDSLEFRLYFLCDYGGTSRTEGQEHQHHDGKVKESLKLHICDGCQSPSVGAAAFQQQNLNKEYAVTAGSESGDTEGAEGREEEEEEEEKEEENDDNDDDDKEKTCLKDDSQDGFRLANLEGFLADHTMAILSLLCALLENNDPNVLNGMTNTISPSRCYSGLLSSTMMTSHPHHKHMAARVRTAMRFLALRAHDVLADFQQHTLMDEADVEEFEEAIPDLKEADFESPEEVLATLFSSTMDRLNNDHQEQGQDEMKSKTEGGSILYRVSHADTICGDQTFWVCRAHRELLGNMEAAETLRKFVKQFHGDVVPIKKSCEVEFMRREDAKAFYGMLETHPWLQKLKLRLAWRDDDSDERDSERGRTSGVTEQDLWELCEAVHMARLRELIIDCCDTKGQWRYHQPWPQEQQVTTDLNRKKQPRLSFRPLLGIICRAGLISLRIENFDGEIFPGGATYKVHGSLRSFSLPEFRARIADRDVFPDTEIVVPADISLRRLTLHHWSEYPDVYGVTSLTGSCCPNLTHLETSSPILEKFIAVLTHRLGKILHVCVYASAYESVELMICRFFDRSSLAVSHPEEEQQDDFPPPPPQSALRGSRRRSNKLPSGVLQRMVALDHWTTTKCVSMWEHPEALQRVIHNNIETLRSVDLACVIERLDQLWSLTTHVLTEAEAIAAAAATAALEAALARGDDDDVRQLERQQQQHHAIRLRLNDLKGHCLESVDLDRSNQVRLVLRSYEDGFRPYLQSLSQFATILTIDDQFVDAEQLELLSQHVALDGLWYYELAWVARPRTLSDRRFMDALRALVRRPEVQKFTIRISASSQCDITDTVATTTTTATTTATAVTAARDGEQDQVQTLLQTWNDLTGMGLGWMEYGRWMQELLVQLDHPFRETLLLPTGIGELTFGSEDVVAIGAIPD